jgi:predicted transcriptional regulator
MDRPMLLGEKRSSFEIICDLLYQLRDGPMRRTRAFALANTSHRVAKQLWPRVFRADLVEELPAANDNVHRKARVALTGNGRLFLDHILAARKLLEE